MWFFLALLLISSHDTWSRGVGPRVGIMTQWGTRSAVDIYDNDQWHKVPFASCDVDTLRMNWCALNAIAKGHADAHAHIAVEGYEREALCVLPDLRVYHVDTRRFVPLFECVVGDVVYTNRGPRAITLLEWQDEPLDVYELEIADHHTYYIGPCELLVHNMVVPVMMSSAGSAALGWGTTIGTAGALAGGATVAAGCLVGGGLFWAGWKWLKGHQRYGQDFEVHISDDVSRRVQKTPKQTPPPSSGNSGDEDRACYCGHACKTYQCCPCGCRCSSKKMLEEERARQNEATGQNGAYAEEGSYHHQQSTGDAKSGKSPAPKAGQKALDNSVLLKGGASVQRLGVSCGQYVVLYITRSATEPKDRIYHGFVVLWEEICKNDLFRNAIDELIELGLITSKGKIL